MTAGAISVPMIIPLRPPRLGQPKNHIDTNTRVEIRTDTPETKIFFTLNNMKPDPFDSYSQEAKATHLYSGPFLLLQGKVSIKALAVSQDNRQSNIVTKVFEVDEVKDDERRNSEEFNFALTNNEARMKAKKMLNNLAKSWLDEKPKKFSKSFKFRPSSASSFTHLLENQSKKYHLKDYSDRDDNQLSKLQKQTDYLKCPHCLAPRPSSDPFSRFCNSCGAKVEPFFQESPNPPLPDQVGKCSNCNNIVPMATKTCIICQSSLTKGNSKNINQGKVSLCEMCGSQNSPSSSHCICCSASLPSATSNVLATINNMIVNNKTKENKNKNKISLVKSCFKCGRVNSINARYCDWCKTKIYDLPGDDFFQPISCSNCQATNQPNSQYCSNCGTIIKDLSVFRPSAESSFFDSLLPLSNKPSVLLTSDASTQTVGLFYPGQVNGKHPDVFPNCSSSQSRPFPTSAISPGKGYWRQQIDHICNRIRTYATNHPSFREHISYARMGNLVTARVNEDDYEFSITLNFSLRGVSKTTDSIGNKNIQNLRQYTSLKELFDEDQKDGDGSEFNNRNSKKDRRSTSRVNMKMKEKERFLLEEMDRFGRGRSTKVQQLIEQGANVIACTSRDGLTLLHSAALFRYPNPIPILVEAGLNVNSVDYHLGNTPLHEAVRHNDPEGEKVVETLLGCGADPTKQNKQGETPYEVAIKLGHENLADKMTVFIGQNNLSKLIKPRKIN